MNDCWIQTYTGRKFHPLDPDPEEVCLDDIAHSLARQARFTGHTKGDNVYSIAQHSVLVALLIEAQCRTVAHWAHARSGLASRTLPRWGVELGYAEARSGARTGLFHDGSEAYLVDLPSPIKHDPRFAFFQVVEDRVLSAVLSHFSLEPGLPPIVKWADAVLFRTEARDLMAPLHPDFSIPDVPELPGRIEAWDWKTAKEEFLAVYGRLFSAP